MTKTQTLIAKNISISDCGILQWISAFQWEVLATSTGCTNTWSRSTAARIDLLASAVFIGTLSQCQLLCLAVDLTWKAGSESSLLCAHWWNVNIALHLWLFSEGRHLIHSAQCFARCKSTRAGTDAWISAMSDSAMCVLALVLPSTILWSIVLNEPCC